MFKEILAGNFPILGKQLYIKFMKLRHLIISTQKGLLQYTLGFPSGLHCKESSCNARNAGSISVLGRLQLAKVNDKEF